MKSDEIQSIFSEAVLHPKEKKDYCFRFDPEHPTHNDLSGKLLSYYDYPREIEKKF